MDLKTLCAQYAPHDYRKRLEAIFRDFDRVLITSSFGTTSAILLHLLHQVKPDHPVYFVDTNYLFKETQAYRETVTRRWNLKVKAEKPGLNAHMYTRMDYTWAHQPDACCYVNKVLPLEPLKASHDLWISGMIGGLSPSRQQRPIFQFDGDMLRFYPLIDMSAEDAHYYQIIHELPEHPLSQRGYGSVGCKQCTAKGQGRSGRWAGLNKTECGLHLFANATDNKQA